MNPPYQKDLWLVQVLSLVGLALIGLQTLQSYPSSLSTYIPIVIYVLLFFLPGYALITAIYPRNDRIGSAFRIVLGFILGLLFLLLIPIAFNYFQLGYLKSLIPTLLFILAILFSILAIRRRISATKDSEGQLTLDESIRRIREIKKKAEGEAILSEEMEEYTPMPAELEEPSQKNRMSVMRLYDTGEIDRKSPKDEKIKDNKPLRDEIIRLKKEEKSGEKTIPLPIEHPVKKEDLLSAFQTEKGRPVWLDHMDDDKSGFRNWDLLLALLLSGLSVSFYYYDPLRTPLLTIIASYAVLLFTVIYTLLVAIFPVKRRIGLLNRIVASSLIAILLLVLVLLRGDSLLLPLILLLALATLILVLVAALRRRSLPSDTTELGLEEIIRRAENLEILVEHDEETLKALKELEKETEEEKPPEKEKKPPVEEIPVIIVEHDQEDRRERETETIIVDHEEKKETEETPYIIVEHDEEDQDIEEPPREVKKDFEKSNISTLINEVIREREQKEKTSPVKEEEEPFLALKSRAESSKKVKAQPIKPIKKNPEQTEGDFSRTATILSVILIIILIIAISATIYIIIKPK
jgi:uncharacterized membrane protein